MEQATKVVTPITKKGRTEVMKEKEGFAAESEARQVGGP